MWREKCSILVFALSMWNDQGCWKDVLEQFFSLWHIFPQEIFLQKACLRKKKCLLIVVGLTPLQSRSIAHPVQVACWPLPFQCLIKQASSLDQGIKVWVICIDFMCRHAAPAMLISVVHKFLFKMSLPFHFLCHQYCSQRGCLLTSKVVVLSDAWGWGYCIFSKFSPISAMQEWVGREIQREREREVAGGSARVQAYA